MLNKLQGSLKISFAAALAFSAVSGGADIFCSSAAAAMDLPVGAPMVTMTMAEKRQNELKELNALVPEDKRTSAAVSMEAQTLSRHSLPLVKLKDVKERTKHNLK